MSTPAIEAKITSTDAVPIWHFDHVNVAMGDSKALSKLFEGVMGLQSGYRPPFPFPGRWLYANGQAVVHAQNDPGLSAETGAISFGHIAFRSDQPAALLVDRLRRSGLSVRIARVPEDKTVQIFVLLPGDFVVELDVPDDDALPEDHTYSPSRAAPGAKNF